MPIIRVAACTLLLALLAGCASTGREARAAYGGARASDELSSTTAHAEQASALPDYREILQNPGPF